MISSELARALQTAGVRWRPGTGDVFRIERDGFESDVFTVSDMTIEAHEYPGGTILGFNGTTEWALDSVSVEDSLWLPRENQLRELLGGTFLGLRRVVGDAGTVHFEVTIELRGTTVYFTDAVAANAYAEALLTLAASASSGVDDLDLDDIL